MGQDQCSELPSPGGPLQAGQRGPPFGMVPQAGRSQVLGYCHLIEEWVVKSEPGGSEDKVFPGAQRALVLGRPLGGLLHPQSPEPNKGGPLSSITCLHDPQQ